jgi:hypothetical protein
MPGAHRDPLAILHTTRDPEEAAWAMAELHRAGFRDVEGIAADFGWKVGAA